MVDNKFVVDSFLEACQNPEFQGKWMTSATWADVISRYYALSPELSYNGKKLIQAIGCSKWLLSIVESNGMINDTISLFRKNYRPKGSKSQITCFYSAPKGSKPSGIDASTKWTTNINEGKELLAKKITRGSTLTFTSSTITDTILKVTVEGKSLTGKRKRPQNHGLTEPGLQATDVSALKNPQRKRFHHWPRPCHPS